MIWLRTLGVAVLTATLGLFVAGGLASLAVDWYSISSFEGGAGFFVVGVALAGAIAGGVIGLAAAILSARRLNAGFLRASAVAGGIVLAIGAAAGAAARLLADVPPQIDGEELLVAVEVRWPAGERPPRDVDGYVLLGSLPRFGQTVRATSTGQLWLEDATEIDGRWIVPGAVELFTERGRRLLDVGIGDQSLAAFIVPLASRPGANAQQWSDWIAHSAAGEAGFSCRYRVVKRNDSVRSQRVGPFALDFLIRGFGPAQVDGRSVTAALTDFRVRHNGQAVSGYEETQSVAAVTAGQPALIVERDGECHLLVSESEGVREQSLGPCTAAQAAHVLTADPGRFRRGRPRRVVPGEIDRNTFAEPGIYLMDNAVIDTRTLSFSELTGERPNVMSEVPPLALSPDEKSYVRLAYLPGSSDQPGLAVKNWASSRLVLLPIDRQRMRYASTADLDPVWVAHHFAWEAGEDGDQRLVERKDVVPLPFRGSLTSDGGYPTYRLEPAGEPMRAALVEFLVRELQAERLPGHEPGAYRHTVRIGGREVHVAASADLPYVLVSLEFGTADDDGLVARIAERFDAVLATGQYDHLFAGSPR